MHRGQKRMLREEGLGPGEHSSVLHLCGDLQQPQLGRATWHWRAFDFPADYQFPGTSHHSWPQGRAPSPFLA